MKLYLNKASPYARLVRVVLMETGLDGETELIFVDPWTDPMELLAVNPAAKVPALVLVDGTSLTESACIADWLIARSGHAHLAPTAHADAAGRLRILGLGRAAMDCAFSGVIQERFATDSPPPSPLAERWWRALPRIAGALDKHYGGRASTATDLADLTVAVAFEYVDFRLPDVPWRDAAPAIARRVAELAGRPSLVETQPD